jgi:ABC-type glycerol-3-phosphate transport system substrate-binding protein
MKRITLLLACVILIFGWCGTLTASNIASHSVTVHVDAINEVAITGGDITLTVNSAMAGSQPDHATNANCHLQWTTNEVGKKITVETDQATQTFTLQVLATGISGGTAAPVVTITDTPADFVTAIATTIGDCRLAYTAIATAAEGTGQDVHTVTYTLTN